MLVKGMISFNVSEGHDKWVPVTMAWHILRYVDGGMASNMEGSCEYIE
jgi:hypothetical protein